MHRKRAFCRGEGRYNRKMDSRAYATPPRVPQDTHAIREPAQTRQSAVAITPQPTPGDRRGEGAPSLRCRCDVRFLRRDSWSLAFGPRSRGVRSVVWMLCATRIAPSPRIRRDRFANRSPGRGHRAACIRSAEAQVCTPCTGCRRRACGPDAELLSSGSVYPACSNATSSPWDRHAALEFKPACGCTPAASFDCGHQGKEASDGPHVRVE